MKERIDENHPMKICKIQTNSLKGFLVTSVLLFLKKKFKLIYDGKAQIVLQENNCLISENTLSTILDEGQYRGMKLSGNNEKCN